LEFYEVQLGDAPLVKIVASVFQEV
jgi:hypothetical protein